MAGTSAKNEKRRGSVSMCKWIVDADQIQLDDYNVNVLYRTGIVNSFLDNLNIFGIEGPKGLGKTFLLKSKRVINQQKGIYCMPKDSMCDILDKVTLNDSMAKYLEDYVNWVDLWKLSICIAIHKEFTLGQFVLNQLTDDDDLYIELYNNDCLKTPCQIMNRILNCQRIDVRKLQTRIPIYIAVIKNEIKSVYDKLNKFNRYLDISERYRKINSEFNM